MLDKRQRGALMDFKLRVEFDNLPQGKEYQFYLQDAGMKRDGLPPALMPERFVADSRGHLELGFNLNQFSKGEWIQCTLRSTDRSIEKSIRFIPFK